MTAPEPADMPAVPPLWWSLSEGLIERFDDQTLGTATPIYQSSMPVLPADAVRLVPYRIRSYWTSQHTWADPDCFECGGEGAPCCEPPDHPWPGEATDLDRLLARCDDIERRNPEWKQTLDIDEIRELLGVTDA